MLILRDETKPNERRAALSPKDARTLVKAGIPVTVESSETRVFADSEYVAAGCSMSAAGSWVNAPKDAFILGLKELPESDTPLKHRHIYFGHAYKNQSGWKQLLGRFVRGGGTLLDLEFLVDDTGRRVAAFGHWAGYAGAAVGADLWAHSILSPGAEYPALSSFSNRGLLLEWLKPRLDQAVAANGGKKPRFIVIGAKGRCGKGAIELLNELDLGSQISAWDQEETKAGGPFKEILDHDVLVNCVLLQGNIAPFLHRDMLEGTHKLRIISDVSCDPNSPNNPLPVYEKTTTFSKPAISLKKDLWLTAIDHLPSLLPRESTEDYSSQLSPHLMALEKGSPVWTRAIEIFQKKSEGI